MEAYNEIQQLQSPIMCRNEIKADLDDVEEEIMDAIECYRTDEKMFLKDFKNYKNYYEDALKYNTALAESLKITR